MGVAGGDGRARAAGGGRVLARGERTRSLGRAVAAVFRAPAPLSAARGRWGRNARLGSCEGGDAGDVSRGSERGKDDGTVARVRPRALDRDILPRWPSGAGRRRMTRNVAGRGGLGHAPGVADELGAEKTPTLLLRQREPHDDVILDAGFGRASPPSRPSRSCRATRLALARGLIRARRLLSPRRRLPARARLGLLAVVSGRSLPGSCLTPRRCPGHRARVVECS